MMSIKEDEGVSCESCHGPGSVYKSMSIMKSKEKSLAKGMTEPTEAVCKTCHNEESPTYRPFNYAEAVKKIAHPNPQTK
jgi:cytochrome c peroxidase